MIFSEDRLCSPRRMEKPDWDCVALGLSIISPGGPGGPIGPAEEHKYRLHIDFESTHTIHF